QLRCTGRRRVLRGLRPRDGAAPADIARVPARSGGTLCRPRRALLAHDVRAPGAPRIPDARVPGRTAPPVHPSGTPLSVRDADIFRRDATAGGADRYFRGHADTPEEAKYLSPD